MMASMRLRDATEMIADSDVEALGPATWADLGAGDGTFTPALAEVLASGSVIHAMDCQATLGSVLRRGDHRTRAAAVARRVAASCSS
jgi:hypothetical protein